MVQERAEALAPGAWVGILGGGQLGRMVVLEARRMGYRTCVLDPDPRCPAGQVADQQVVAAYDDPEGARTLAERVAVVTYEFENVDASAVAAVEPLRPVYPSSRVLWVCQHRVREKQALAQGGFPVPAFYPVDTPADLAAGLQQVGLPAVLKTATAGYDGKGQAVVHTAAEAEAAYSRLRPQSEMLILEAFVPFTLEVSVVCARDREGRTACFPVAENIHRGGILDTSIVPARVPPAVAAAAQELAAGIAAHLGVVGLLAVEMFVLADGRILVNELAPRPHNSGHYTWEACATSQFEQLLRIVCGLPLGSTELLAPAVMVNLLGDLWAQGDPDFPALLAEPGVALHLYGKAEARPGRKMGHFTAVGRTVEEALARAEAARRRLVGGQARAGG